MGLPSLQVLLDDGSGTFPINITAKTLNGPGWSVSRGREDWQGAVTAGGLSLTLDNSDGRFTVGSTFYGSPSPIYLDQRIRIRESIDGITWVNRFTGYVKSWPVAWPAVVSTVAHVQVSATDAQARAERQPLLSVIQQEILADSPAAYYMLSEPEGATSAMDSSGNQASALTMAGSGTGVTFGAGAGPGTDSLSAATFAGGQYLAAPAQGLTILNFTLEAFFATTSTSVTIVGLWEGDGPAQMIRVNSTGKLSLGFSGSDNIASAASVNDGAVHHAAFTCDGGTGLLELFLDGVSQGTFSAGPVLFPKRLVAGAGLIQYIAYSVFTGTISHVALSTSVLSSATILRHATAGLIRFTGESGTARLTRLAGYANLPVGTLDTSLTNVPFKDTAGQSVADAIRDVTDAEVGLTFINGSGNLTFHNRNRAPAKTSPDLILDKQWVTPDVQPVVDDERLLNYFEATATREGAPTQLVRNKNSEVRHGRYSDSATYLVQTDAEALDRGNWLVSNLAEPAPRYGTLTINLFGMPATLQQSVLNALDLNCWLRVKGMPSQNPGSSTVDVVVQGWSEEQSANAWTIRCNVVARSLFQAWILGDATYGVLDSATRLYV